MLSLKQISNNHIFEDYWTYSDELFGPQLDQHYHIDPIEDAPHQVSKSKSDSSHYTDALMQSSGCSSNDMYTEVSDLSN